MGKPKRLAYLALNAIVSGKSHKFFDFYMSLSMHVCLYVAQLLNHEVKC